MKRGFDRSFVCIDGAMNYFGHDPQGKPAPLKLDDQAFVPPEQGFYSTDAFTDYAIQFVQQARDASKPFFLYLAFNAPHWPLQALPEDIEKYRGKYAAGWQSIRKARHAKQVELGLVPADSPMAPMDRGNIAPWDRLTDPQRSEWDLRMAVYAAQVDRMDRNVGRLLDALARLKIDDNTLVMFLSDNGGAAEDPNRSQPDAATGTQNSFVGYARPWASVSNTPLRLHKSTVHEGGISAPCIVRWPNVIKQDRHNSLVTTPAHLIDLMPTCLELTGASPPARKLEGVSLAPLLRSAEPIPPRLLFWEHEGNRAVRDGHWKLVQHYGTPWELYDLDADRTESHDLSAQNSQLVENFKQQYDTWAQRCGVLTWEKLSATRPAE
jgi:arylsulfatase